MKRNVLIRSVILAITLLWSASLASAANDKRRNSPGREPASAASASTATAAANSFEAFGLIAERNIFNPNRAVRTAPAPEVKPLRVDEISLVGTMTSDQGLLAFFESADSRFRKTVRVGEAIAEFKVERITSGGVDLVRGEESALALRVAQRLRRIAGGDWTVDTSGTDAAQGTGLTSGRREAEPGAPAEIPVDASDVLKRLMKKREKQLN